MIEMYNVYDHDDDDWDNDSWDDDDWDNDNNDDNDDSPPRIQKCLSL